LAGLLAAPAFAAKTTATTTSTVNLAPLARASGWLENRVSTADLLGHAVVVDVFTFECINCVRVLPNLKRLYASYSRSDLRIVGVHSPEVPSYQRRRSYLAREKAAAAIPWPIAIDNDFRIWNAYGVSAWPTLLIFDRKGNLHTTIIGDGRDSELAAAVREVAHRS